jgi:hypothetical protein
LLQEFSDPQDADDARYGLDGREIDGSRIIVEFAKGVSSYCLSMFFTTVPFAQMLFTHVPAPSL